MFVLPLWQDAPVRAQRRTEKGNNKEARKQESEEAFDGSLSGTVGIESGELS